MTALTPKKQVEYERVFAESKNVVNDAYDVLFRHGAESKEFATIAATRTMLWSRMRELQGLSSVTTYGQYPAQNAHAAETRRPRDLRRWF